MARVWVAFRSGGGLGSGSEVTEGGDSRVQGPGVVALRWPWRRALGSGVVGKPVAAAGAGAVGDHFGRLRRPRRPLRGRGMPRLASVEFRPDSAAIGTRSGRNRRPRPTGARPRVTGVTGGRPRLNPAPRIRRPRRGSVTLDPGTHTPERDATNARVVDAGARHQRRARHPRPSPALHARGCSPGVPRSALCSSPTLSLARRPPGPTPCASTARPPPSHQQPMSVDARTCRGRTPTRSPILLRLGPPARRPVPPRGSS